MSTAPRNAAAKRDWGHDERGCTVLHIDMDAFYASLEIARHPELRGRPVIIGTGNRAVVSAASYEARRYGVNSAMAAATAHRLCPDGVFLPVDGAYYRQVSREIFHGILGQVTDRIEQVSVDECYMDVAGALRQWERPTAIARWVRAEVARRFNITCSVGIAGNKLVAKMASTNAKPDGMLLIPLDRHAEFVQMMPLRGIPGIGPALEKRLNGWGVMSVADLAKLTEEQIGQITGSASSAHGLFLAARGQDSRPVVPFTPEKSIGAERTFDEDTRDAATVTSLLRWCASRVASSLRRRGLVGRTVTVKLRFADLSYRTRSHTLAAPVDSAAAIFPAAVELFGAMTGMMDDPSAESGAGEATSSSRLRRAVRLAGVSVSGLSDAATTAVQLSFDDMMPDDSSGNAGTAKLPGAPGASEATHGAHRTLHHAESKTDRLRDAEAALDTIRRKFGNGSAQLGV
ncbi:DNA polymerase IV [Bifidobacterium choloepi]|uniref:DNA polymerase IV n=1 Tax=Bifidobacterium choloepi TaxID=2614131 RepID=A0A6I5NB29_9BIFI|nr:DNA polymerase IV [Bifidobacterium choloepi]NEG69670.1 DNA polymerase IV [Bifidobacterium choloepi]